MNLNLNFDFNQSQKLLLTPRLKLALEILEMSSQELFEYIEEQIEANPILDIAEVGIEKYNSLIIASIEELEWEKHLNAIKSIEMHDFKEELPFSIELDKKQKLLTLKEYLLYQLHSSALNKKQEAIAEELLSKIDTNGYFTGDTETMASDMCISQSELVEVLEQMQLLEPPGIMARNLRECLLIQFRKQGFFDKDIKRIIEDKLDQLAEGKISVVSKNTGISHKKVSEVFNILKTLEPKPAREFYESQDIKLVIPDILVKKVNGIFQPKINYDAVPHICICKYYSNILKQDISTDTRKFIENKINNAVWLIKCIELRSEILLKLAKCIVDSENNFLENGRKYKVSIDPILAAKEAGIHKSIVYKILSGKYLECSWGVFDLRYFIV